MTATTSESPWHWWLALVVLYDLGLLALVVSTIPDCARIARGIAHLDDGIAVQPLAGVAQSGYPQIGEPAICVGRLSPLDCAMGAASARG